MSRDRQQQMSELYHAAFLEEACDGDAALREEVESLLGYEPARCGFSRHRRRSAHATGRAHQMRVT